MLLQVSGPFSTDILRRVWLDWVMHLTAALAYALGIGRNGPVARANGIGVRGGQGQNTRLTFTTIGRRPMTRAKVAVQGAFSVGGAHREERIGIGFLPALAGETDARAQWSGMW